MASLAFCVALAMMTSAISSIAEATDAGDWYVDLGKSENVDDLMLDVLTCECECECVIPNTQHTERSAVLFY